MNDRTHLPANFFGDDVYTITPQTNQTDDRWLTHEPEGQLSVDVFETPEAVIILAPVSGTKPENLEIYVSNDLVTIRGRREDHSVHENRNYLFEECYWGNFSRSIILPFHVSSEKAEAVLKNGLLTITLPKTSGTMYIPVSEVYDDI